MPSSVFPSDVEEKVGMLNRAPPQSGIFFETLLNKIVTCKLIIEIVKKKTVHVQTKESRSVYNFGRYTKALIGTPTAVWGRNTRALVATLTANLEC